MSFGTFAFSPPMEDPSSTSSSSSSRSTSVHQQEVARLKTPTAAHPYYTPGGPPSPLSYSPFAMSPHQFDSNLSGPTLNELNEFHPQHLPPNSSSSTLLPHSSYNLNSPQLDDGMLVKSEGQSPYSFHHSSSHDSGLMGGGGGGRTSEGMDGFGELVGSAFGSNGILEQGNPMTAFGSLPAFDQTQILAHRSSFDPPSSASSFASTDRPGTAGGAATLINMSRSGAVYGEPGAGYPDEGSVMVAGGGIYQAHGGSRFGGGSLGGGAFNSGGVDESRRSSPYDGTNSPSSNGSTSHHPHPLQQPYPSYLRQYNNNRYPTPPDGISPAQTQPSFADLPPSSSSTATEPPLPLFYNTQNDPYANPNASRRASESHLVQQMSHSFYNQNPAAFHSPSNTPPLATPAAQGQPHQYSTPSSTSSAHIVNPNLRVSVPARRPSTSSAARRPSSSSHAQSFDSSLQQHFVSRPQQQHTSRMQQQPHHPYATNKRRESMGVVPSSTSSQGYWDQGGGGTLSMGGQMFSPMAGGGSSMRPQTSDGIPGSALSDFSAIPNFFYPLAPSHSTTAPSSASASISPGNLIRQPYSTFLNTSSGSDFPLQQPIFAPPMPTSRRSSNAVLTTSSILPVPSSSNSNSSTITPSSTPSSSSFNGAPGTSRPSTAPSLGHRGSISNSKGSLNDGLVVVPPHPHPHPPPHQLLPSTSETQQPLPAAFQQLLTSEPQDDTKSKVKTLIKSESNSNGAGASGSKKDNISPVTGRPKRPRRKHEEVERLYACLAPTCGKAYGTLNHLNQHILTQNHGEKRTPAEFRDLRRAWRRKRKEQNALASAANKLAKSKAGGGKGGASTSKTNAGVNVGRRASTGGAGAGAAGPSTDKLGRRRSSATSRGLGDDDDSDSDEDYSDQDEPSSSHPQSHQQQQQLIVPSVLSPTYPSSSSNSNSSGSHHNPFDAPSSSSYPPNNTYQQHLSLSSGSTSPLDPHMPFFSGPPSSTSFSPAQTYSNGTPDFNHWAFTTSTSSESASLPPPPPSGGTTPGSSSAYRNGAGSGSGLVHSSGFSPTATAASSGSATLVVSPQTGPMGRPRRIGTRRSSVNYTIEETFEV